MAKFPTKSPYEKEVAVDVEERKPYPLSIHLDAEHVKLLGIGDKEVGDECSVEFKVKVTNKSMHASENSKSMSMTLLVTEGVSHEEEKKSNKERADALYGD